MATKALTDLLDTVAALRGPGGCPWDREQTHQSLKHLIVEETGELLDAIDDDDDNDMVDELGDVLLHILLHCQIAREQDRFDIRTVARRCREKLIRRHPHVFADATVDNAAAVLDQWDAIKRAERKDGRRSTATLGTVPRHLPALHRAQKMQQRAAKAGFDWPSVDGVLAKIDEELAEVRHAIEVGDDASVAEEMGDLLFSVVNLCRFRREHAEELLHDTVRKFERRFTLMEERLSRSGRTPTDCTLTELDELWEQTKGEGNGKGG